MLKIFQKIYISKNFILNYLLSLKKINTNLIKKHKI